MILVDTGPIVALFDRDDGHHSLCTQVLKGIKEGLVTTWPVITECFSLLNFSWEVQDDLWEFIQRGGMEIYSPDRGMQIRSRELMERYRALPMDLADATLVALAESLRLTRVFTLDRKDFSLYRILGKKRFTLIPSKLP